MYLNFIGLYYYTLILFIYILFNKLNFMIHVQK